MLLILPYKPKSNSGNFTEKGIPKSQNKTKYFFKSYKKLLNWSKKNFNYLKVIGSTIERNRIYSFDSNVFFSNE